MRRGVMDANSYKWGLVAIVDIAKISSRTATNFTFLIEISTPPYTATSCGVNYEINRFSRETHSHANEARTRGD